MDIQKDWALEVGLVESRFWQMQPWQLEERVAVYQRKRERERERDAFVVHHIQAAFVGYKNAMSIGRLTGKVTDGDAK